MIRILFVCHGNICRSPMAEYWLRHLVEEAGLSRQFDIASAATSSEEIWNGVGSPVHTGTKNLLRQYGISMEEKRAVKLTRADYEKYDYLIGMDGANLKNMQRILGEDKKKKCHLLLDYTDDPRDIADPWYTGNFQKTFQDIDKGCRALLKTILQNQQMIERYDFPVDRAMDLC